MVGIWSYAINSMWFVGVLWFLMTLGTGLAKVLCVVRPNQKERARLAQLTSRCHVLRGGEWVDVQASDIVLRDVVRIDGGASVLPCDGILLEGALVVDESTLSGEPAPVQKLPAERSSTSAAPRSSLAFAGTTCLQSAGPRDGRAVMLATAVGALTARGRLVRASPAPPGVRFKGCDQLPVVYATLGIYAIGLFVVHAFYLNARSWITMYMQLLNIVAMCLNPMLPVSLAMGQSLAAARLRGRWQINCLQPSRIPVAGSVSTMVFDKTGTITEGGMDLDSVIDVQDRCFGRRYKLGGCPSGPSADAGAVGHELPAHARRAMASCHAVEALEDGTLVGSQLEVAMVRASGWQQVAQGVVRSANGKESLEVLRRLRFDDRRALSGAVVRCPRTRESYVYLKGSHEAIQAVATPSSTPSGYAGLAEHCAKDPDGFYTLGLAMKCLPLNLSSQHIADMPRSSLEANVGVCGLLLFRNEVRPDSSQVFKDLRQGSIRSVICTGDGALTAISVGRRSGVVTTSVVLLGDVRDDTLLWNPDSGSSWDADAVASSDCQLAVTRPAWRYLRERGALLEPLWTRLVVLARTMRPDDKASVVRYLQSRGLVVGMCGDGGNDGGALRAADVGLALSDAAASMPRGLDGLGFSAAGGAESPALVVHLIRLATVQYFVVHALATTGIGTALAIWEGIGLGDFAWLVVDVVIGTLMAAAMTWSGPSDRTAAAALFPCATALVALAAGFALLWSKGWYRRLNPVADLGLDESQWWLRGDNYDAPVGLVVLLLALATTAFVNTYGGSFRQSVLRNWGVCFLHALVLAVLFWLVLRGPSQFGCVFRVNCDTRHSLLSARELWPLGLLSEGWRLRAASGVGGCFLGAQLLVWQSELAAANYSDPLHGSASGRWLPSKDDDCRPPASHGTAPYGDPLISTLGCEGPNNCYDSRFSYELAAVMVAYVVSNHLFAKGADLGAAAGADGAADGATADLFQAVAERAATKSAEFTVELLHTVARGVLDRVDDFTPQDVANTAAEAAAGPSPP
ncbi:unnamed protein product [Prorocentrum cordatum]|uniref:P-type ATPase A domain-containing protein n=1 Tax=Prorocentrum cordatum TaxID=2364126 RepID=A0ABN9XYU6_9DINO|nr:unnamed protein product [Polarella glacialis]